MSNERVDNPIGNPVREFKDFEGAFHETLFKYKAWDEWGKKMLKDGSLYFTSPGRFNDPFDCKISVAYHLLTPKEHHQLLKQKAREHLGVSSSQAFQVAHKMFKDKYWESAEGMKREQETVDKSLGVLSLTPDYRNLLMWSHYSEFHKGLCIGLNTSHLQVLACHLLTRRNPIAEESCTFYLDHVTYGDYPEIHPHDDVVERAQKSMLHKYGQWSYEEEVRGWIHIPKKVRQYMDGLGDEVKKKKLDTKFRTIQAPPELFTHVVLGCKMPDEDRQEITELVKAELPHMEVWQAHKKPYHFALNFEPVYMPEKEDSTNTTTQD